TGYLPFDSAPRPSFVVRLRLSPQLGRIFFKKQTSSQLDAQFVIAICVLYPCYLQAGMSDSAEICRQEIISVPEMLAQVESNTDPLAWKIADRPQLTLPEEYRIRIAQMQD
ncbi:hypothetical protein MR730_04205, partial [bacterium]|nr:hypothetical protein [bacterium]